MYFGKAELCEALSPDVICVRIQTGFFAVSFENTLLYRALLPINGMKKNDELFQLIHSLSPSEKRYFKMFADRHTKNGRNNYIRLFDALSAMKDYDEEGLRQQLSDAALAKNLSSTKYQLVNLLLRSMCAFHAGKSPDSELSELMESVKLLYNRGLYSLCRKFLVKAKKMAEEYERHYVLLELLNLERTMFFKWQTKNVERELNSILDHEKSIVEKISNEAEFAHLYTRFVAFRKIRLRARSADESLRLEEILKDPLLQNEDRALTFQARSTFFRLHGQCALLKSDNESAYYNHSKLIDLWNAHPRFITTDLKQYKADLTNYLNSCLASDNFDAIEPTLERFRALPSTSLDDEVMTFQHVQFIELLHYLYCGELEKCEKVISEIEAGFVRYEGKLTHARIMTFQHNITIFYFVSGNYDKTLEWLEKILDQSNVELRQDIQDFARILMLFVHYELQNHDVLEYLIRSTYRYLHKRNKLYEYERTVLNHFRKLLENGEPHRTLDILRAMHDDLTELQQKSGDKKSVGLREILFWLESKIEGIAITELFLRKVGERMQTRGAGSAA